MDNRIEYVEGGLKCDNSSCNWKDATIDIKDYESYINSACPECGENILTQEDYDSIKLVLSIIDGVNNMSEEDLDVAVKSMGIEVDDPNQIMKMTINTHKGISIEISEEE